MCSQAEKRAGRGRRAGLWTKVSPVAFLRRGFPRSRPKTRTKFYSFFRSSRSMKRAGRGDGSRRPKIFGVAGKGDSIRSRGDSARYHHQEKAGIFGDFVRAPECGQKKRAGTCVPAQPFRLSPPETVEIGR